MAFNLNQWKNIVAAIDYMKALDILAASLGADHEIHVNPGSRDLKTLSVTMKSEQGRVITCVLNIGDYLLKIEIPRAHLPDIGPARWLRDLEFRLEQAFFVNINTDIEEKKDLLYITISF